MKLTLLCNAGLAIQEADSILLVDLPNQEYPPFYTIPEETWRQILERRPPYDRVCGFYFTHAHPDHCCKTRVEEYLHRWPGTPCFFPDEHEPEGEVSIGPFRMQFRRMEHVPIPSPPVLVATILRAGEKSLYLPSDAALDCAAHRAFLAGRRATAGIWTSMYLSLEDTRNLMKEAAVRNYIYHMPAERPDAAGLWRKVDRNLERYGAELEHVTVWERYPAAVEI